jgi:anaerobic nitric oxide reductase transcription regulator
MTAKPLLTALLPLVEDLSRELPETERYRRLLDALRALLPCDAAALLRLDGPWLIPLAVDGLSTDTLGRRFKVDEHPRFQQLLSSPTPTRFDSHSPLPDPYDGLVEGLHDQLHVHDCMGCPLLIDGRPWGLLTLDALDPQRFDHLEPGALQAFASLAAATVTLAERIQHLARRAEDEHLRAEGYRQASGQHGQPMIGQSPAFKRLQAEIELVGHSDLTVLITGETGVGKELVAQAIHRASARAQKPLVSINCAALPENLVESELFGHVRGAFTGAQNERRGKFELADGGTLFLDEVGELPLAVQAKLLRVLQSGQLQRLGSDKDLQVDVRVIAATNRNLAQEVRASRYRADFYHRLSVFPLHIPPLRERERDVLLLSGYFLELNRSRLGLEGLRLDADAQAALLAYTWPGNVRELEHLIGRSALKAWGRRGDSRLSSLGAADLNIDPAPDGAMDGATRPATAAPPAESAILPDGSLRLATDAYHRQLIEACLARHGHNWASAARELGLDRANLNRMAKRLLLK